MNSIEQTVCSGENLQISTGAMSATPIWWTWMEISNSRVVYNAPNNMLEDTNGDNIISVGTLSNPTNMVQTIVFEVTPSYASPGCSGNTFAIKVRVQPKPQINPVAINVCSGENVIVAPAAGTDGTVPAGTTYSWTQVANGGVDGASASGSGSVIELGRLGNATGTAKTVTYSVIPAINGYAGDPFTVVATVESVLQVQVLLISSGLAYCAGESVTLTADATPTDYYEYDWYRDNVLVASGSSNTHVSSGLASRATAYQYHVVVRSATLCGESRSNTVDITVTAPQTAVATLNYADICASGTIRATASIAQPDDYTFVWYLNGGVAGRGRLLALSGLMTGKYTLRVEATPTPSCPGCAVSSASISFTVHPDPVVTIVAGNTEICARNAISANVNDITLHADVHNKNNYTLRWVVNEMFIDGAIQEAFSQTASEAGTYRITARLIATNDVGCISEWSKPVTVTVRDAPKVTLVSDNHTYYNNGSVRLTANVTPAGNYVYDWYRDNIRIVTGGGNTHVSSGIASRATGYVCHVVARPSSGCEGRSNEVAITVGNLQTTSITLDRTQICAGGSVTATVHIVSPENHAYKWYLNGYLPGYERQIMAINQPGGIHTLYLEASPIIPCSECVITNSSVTITFLRPSGALVWGQVCHILPPMGYLTSKESFRNTTTPPSTRRDNSVTTSTTKPTI